MNQTIHLLDWIFKQKIDEFRITGPKTGSVGISSIKAGDGATGSNVITVTTSSALSGVDVDTAIVIDGITATGYDGQHVVTDKISNTVFNFRSLIKLGAPNYSIWNTNFKKSLFKFSRLKYCSN